MDYLNDVRLPEGYSFTDYSSQHYGMVEDFWNRNGLGGKHRGDNPGIIEATLAGGGHLILLWSPGGQLAGTSWLTNDRRRTYLHHFGIDEPLRGLGLSKALLAESLRLAAADGFQIKIEVHRANTAALHLYTRAGFTPLGEYDVYMIRNPERLQ